MINFLKTYPLALAGLNLICAKGGIIQRLKREQYNKKIR